MGAAVLQGPKLGVVLPWEVGARWGLLGNIWPWDTVFCAPQRSGTGRAANPFQAQDPVNVQ